MDKQLILEALQHARTMYERAVNCRITTFGIFYNTIIINDMSLGLCRFFQMNYSMMFSQYVTDELKKDRIDNSLFHRRYWYSSAYTYKITKDIQAIKTNCLQPRLDHLNRTIARLEQEIAAEAPATPQQ